MLGSSVWKAIAAQCVLANLAQVLTLILEVRMPLTDYLCIPYSGY